MVAWNIKPLAQEQNKCFVSPSQRQIVYFYAITIQLKRYPLNSICFYLYPYIDIMLAMLLGISSRFLLWQDNCPSAEHFTKHRKCIKIQSN